MSGVFIESRVWRWFVRTWKTRALTTELMRVANKTPLIKASRWLMDALYFLQRRRRTGAPSTLNGADARNMLGQLRHQGWAHVPDSISPNIRRSIREECLALRQKYHDMKTREPGRYKDIWNYISDIGFGRECPGSDNVFVQYATSKPILDVVAGYLGEIPWLRYIILTESVYQEGGLKFSQKWHLDFDDARMVKLFIYLTDVSTAADGPFQLISAELSARVRNSFVRRHIDDAQLFARIEPDAPVNMMGPALTSFLADTGRVYHCGSRLAPGHSRLLYTALYTAYPSIYPGGREMFSVAPETPEYLQQVLTPISARRQD